MIKKTIEVRLDDSTGAVVGEAEKEYKIKSWKDNKGAMVNYNKYHIKMYKNDRLVDEINNRNDLLKTYILTEKIYKDTNIIYYKKDGVLVRPATIEDISEMIDVNTRGTKEYLKRMMDKGIIAELTIETKNTKSSSYVFNPVYVNSMRYINTFVYSLFKPDIDNYLPQEFIEKYALLENSTYENAFVVEKGKNSNGLWLENYGAMLKPKNKHSKVFNGTPFSEILETKQYTYNTYVLAENTMKDTNIIYVDNKIANIDNISKLFDMSVKRTREYVNSLIKHKIIGKSSCIVKGKEVECYVFNPLHVNACKYIPLNVYLCFKEDLDKVFPKWIINKYKELEDSQNAVGFKVVE